MQQIDYLVVGHLSRDVTPQGYTVGGTVSYAGIVAQALGCQTAVLTSAAPAEPLLAALPGVTIHTVPAAETTTFDNVYTPQGRVQTMHAAAGCIKATHLPAGWPSPAIVHFGPVANEIDPALVRQFPHSVIGLTPQGWMRRWDEQGRVYTVAWPEAEEILPLATAVVLSEEDFPSPDMQAQFRQWARLLVITRGRLGCVVYENGRDYSFAAPDVTEIEPTGAGDIFAAAFFIRLHQTKGDVAAAAQFANQIAALSVTQAGLMAKAAHIRQHLAA